MVGPKYNDKIKCSYLNNTQESVKVSCSLYRLPLYYSLVRGVSQPFILTGQAEVLRRDLRKPDDNVAPRLRLIMEPLKMY